MDHSLSMDFAWEIVYACQYLSALLMHTQAQVEHNNIFLWCSNKIFIAKASL